jgi:hypothetical protein
MLQQSSWSALGAITSIVLSLPLALLAAACWARFAPLEEQTRFVSAMLFVIVGWIAATCAFSASRQPAAALAIGLAACAAFSLCLYCGS